MCVYVGRRWAEAVGPLQSASFSLFLLLFIFLVSKLKEKGQEITRSSDLTWNQSGPATKRLIQSRQWLKLIFKIKK